MSSKGGYASPRRRNNLVDPSMSVTTKVTKPDGSVPEATTDQAG
jgi:hypothetical protein